MRSLQRRKQEIWCVEATRDDSTIEGSMVYGKPEKHMMSVSNTSGTPHELPVGIVAEYSRYIVSFDRDFQPHEGLMVFIDIEPRLVESGEHKGELEINEETGKPYTEPDYVVTHLMDTQKGTIARYGIKKVAGDGQSD